MKFILLASYAVTDHDDMDVTENLRNIGMFNTIFQASQAAKEDLVSLAEELTDGWYDRPDDYETLSLEAYKDLETDNDYMFKLADLLNNCDFSSYLERLEHENEIKKFSLYQIGEHWYGTDGWYEQDNYYIMRIE